MRDVDLKAALAGKRGIGVDKLIGALAKLHLPATPRETQHSPVKSPKKGDAEGEEAGGGRGREGLGVGGGEGRDAVQGSADDDGDDDREKEEEEEGREEEEKCGETVECEVVLQDGARFVLSASLPRMEGLDGAALNVSSTRVMFESCGYVIDHAWPSEVDAEACCARFSKKKRVLTVTAPKAS